MDSQLVGNTCTLVQNKWKVRGCVIPWHTTNGESVDRQYLYLGTQQMECQLIRNTLVYKELRVSSGCNTCTLVHNEWGESQLRDHTHILVHSEWEHSWKVTPWYTTSGKPVGIRYHSTERIGSQLMCNTLVHNKWRTSLQVMRLYVIPWYTTNWESVQINTCTLVHNEWKVSWEIILIPWYTASGISFER